MDRRVVHGCTTQRAQEVHCHFMLLSGGRLDDFLAINEDVFKEAVKLFYANLSISEALKGIKPVLKSFLLGTPIGFTLSTLYEILNLPKKCDHVYLSAYDKLPSFGEYKFKIYSLISIDGEKPNTATRLKPDFPIISEWCIGNDVHQEVGKTFSTSSSPFLVLPHHLLEDIGRSHYLRVYACHPSRYHRPYPTVIQTLSFLWDASHAGVYSF